jgi:uncharacterized protein DUF547
MKKTAMIVGFLLSSLIANSQSLNNFLDEADAFFKTHVVSGKVDYVNLEKKGNPLNSLVKQIATIDIKSLGDIERKAFLINAYNISVINGIMENYPTESPLKITGFFDAVEHNIGGTKTTLNALEKEQLIKVTGDERLHFVLVCAAISCPPIASYAYRPDKLEKQIEGRTRLALNNNVFVQVDDGKETVNISEIFKWYKGDFSNKAPSIIEYLNKYRFEEIPSNYKTGYYTYDWNLNGQSPKKETEPTSNLQTFTPSVLLNKGQVELKSFYNIYSQNKVRNEEGNNVSLDGRQSFFNVQYQLTFGVSKSARFNIGFDLLVSSFSDGNSRFSPVFQSGDFNAIVLAAFGPSIKFTPFKKISNLSVRSAFLFPGAKNLESRDGRFIAHDRYTWNTQLFFDQKLTNRWRLFLEAGLIYRFAKNPDQVDFFRTPLTGIVSFFPSQKISLFVLYQYSPRFQVVSNGFDEVFGLSQWFQQAGLGLKYQLGKGLEVEASYTNFFASRNDGGGSTFNLGFRWIN